MTDWGSVQPVMTPQDARVLFSFYHGCRNLGDVVQVFDFDKTQANVHARAAERLGYIYYDTMKRHYVTTMTWDEVVDDIKKRIRVHMTRQMDAVEDLRDVEAWWDGPQ